MSETLPLITIAITCFNAEDSILCAIDSALAQDWPNKEILIADDCSTDASRQIVSEKIAAHPEARLIANDINRGTGFTRNRLLNEAKGEFIAFFDDDDESLPARIRAQYERIVSYELESGQKLVACYASGVRYYPNGYKKELVAIGSHPVIPQGQGLAESILFYGQRKNWFYGSGTPTCSLMAKISVLKQTGGFDENFRRVEDLDISIRLSLMGASFIGCPETLFIQHASAGSDKSSGKNLEAEFQLAEKYKDFLKSIGMYTYARTWPKLRHYHFTKQYFYFLAALAYLVMHYPVKTLTHIFDTGPKRLRHERKMAS